MADNKNPARGRDSALHVCSDSGKHLDSNASADDKSIAPVLAVYFIEHAGLFEHRSAELLGIYDKPYPAISRLFECTVDLHWRYRPVPEIENLHRVVSKLRDGLKSIAQGDLLAVEYLLPTAFRDADAAIIGITRMPEEHDDTIESVMAVKIKAGHVHELRFTPSVASVSYRCDLFSSEAGRVS